MPLQLRRGVEADRTTIVPANGELIYTTDTKQVYVGDGSTIGGTAVTGGSGLSFTTIAVAGQGNIIADSATDTLTFVAGSGVTLTTNTGSDSLTIAVNSNLSVNTTGVHTGNIFTNLIDSADSSEIVVTPSLRTNSNLTVENDLNVKTITNTDVDSKIRILLNTNGRITTNANIVFGNIRDASVESEGNIWEVNSTGLGGGRGITIDNSLDITKTTAFVLRQYRDTVTSASRIVFEKSRGTVANPTALQFGDNIANIGFSGTSTTGFVNSRSDISVTPGFILVNAQENWISNTNLGTRLQVYMAPLATTITSIANLIPIIVHDPQISIYRSDSFTFRQGKTGTTDYLTLTATGMVSNVPQKHNCTEAGNFAGGSTYTPAATVNNTIKLTINSGTGGLAINVTNLDTESYSGSEYRILVNNTSGSTQTVSTTNAVVNVSYALPTGQSTVIKVMVLGTSTFCELLDTNSIGSINVSGSVITSTDSSRIEFQENVNVVGNFTVEGTLGYGTGTGGTISQSGSKTSAVTFNRACGTITMASGSMNSGDEVSFTVNNTFVDDTDVVLMSIKSGGTAGAYLAQCDQVNNNSFRVTVTNISNSTLNEALALNFIIVKSVSA